MTNHHQWPLSRQSPITNDHHQKASATVTIEKHPSPSPSSPTISSTIPFINHQNNNQWPRAFTKKDIYVSTQMLRFISPQQPITNNHQKQFNPYNNNVTYPGFPNQFGCHSSYVYNIPRVTANTHNTSWTSAFISPTITKLNNYIPGVSSPFGCHGGQTKTPIHKLPTPTTHHHHHQTPTILLTKPASTSPPTTNHQQSPKLLLILPKLTITKPLHPLNPKTSLKSRGQIN